MASNMRSRWLLFAVCALVAALLLAHGADASGADLDDDEFDVAKTSKDREFYTQARAEEVLAPLLRRL